MTRCATMIALALLALLSSGPVHEGLHHDADAVAFDGVQLHGEDCEHFEDEGAHHDCGLCVAARVALASASAGAAASPAQELHLGLTARAGARSTAWLTRVHGARAPPANS